MYKTILVDDERNGLQVLQWQINRHCPDLQIVATCASPRAAIEEIRKHNPDLVFLDIEMPQMSGFEMLQQLNPISFQVVFTTAYNEVAIKSFKVNTLNYLLKPIDSHELKEVVLKLDNSRRNQSAVPNTEGESAINQKRVAIAAQGSMVLIDPRTVMWCEGDNSQTRFHMFNQGQKMNVARPLHEIENMLADYGFFRIHPSSLVNATYIQEFKNQDRSEVVMKDGTRLAVDNDSKNRIIGMFPPAIQR